MQHPIRVHGRNGKLLVIVDSDTHPSAIVQRAAEASQALGLHVRAHVTFWGELHAQYRIAS